MVSKELCCLSTSVGAVCVVVRAVLTEMESNMSSFEANGNIVKQKCSLKYTVTNGVVFDSFPSIFTLLKSLMTPVKLSSSTPNKL